MGQKKRDGGIVRMPRVFAWVIWWMKALTEMHYWLILGSTFFKIEYVEFFGT